MQYCVFLTGLPWLAAKSRDWFKVFKLETVCLFLPSSHFDGLGMYGHGEGKLDLAVVPMMCSVCAQLGMQAELLLGKFDG